MKIILSYIVSLKLTWTTLDPVSKKQKKTSKQTNKKIKPYAARAAAGDVALRLVGLEAQDSAPRITKQRNKATRKDAPGPGGSGLKASGYTAFLV